VIGLRSYKGRSYGPKGLSRGLAEVEVLWEIGDREIGKQKVCNIGDCKTPKPKFLFSCHVENSDWA
jgi:hypothetical protein